jgi:hypothetical protein
MYNSNAVPKLAICNLQFATCIIQRAAFRNLPLAICNLQFKKYHPPLRGQPPYFIQDETGMIRLRTIETGTWLLTTGNLTPYFAFNPLLLQFDYKSHFFCNNMPKKR